MMHNFKANCKEQNLKEIRNFVEKVLEQHLIPEVETGLLVLAVDEICANLMYHGHNCRADEVIEISIIRQTDCLIFEIRDESDDAFDITRYEAPPMQQVIRERRAGGIGLILVKKIADQLYYAREGRENVCRLVKRI
jgi:serine/threonine-protein kinase RsbW